MKSDCPKSQKESDTSSGSETDNDSAPGEGDPSKAGAKGSGKSSDRSDPKWLAGYTQALQESRSSPGGQHGPVGHVNRVTADDTSRLNQGQLQQLVAGLRGGAGARHM